MHLFNSSIPQLEFASLSLLLVDAGAEKGINNDHDESSEGTINTNKGAAPVTTADSDAKPKFKKQVDTLIEIFTVTSPLSTTPPSIANRAFRELHDTLSQNLSPNKRERKQKNPKNGSNNSNSSNTVRNNTKTQKEGRSDKNENEDNVAGDNDADKVLISSNHQSISDFALLCFEEEEHIFCDSINTRKSTSIDPPGEKTAVLATNVHGFTFTYCLIRDEQTVSKCLSILNPMAAGSIPNVQDIAVVISVGSSGVPHLYHSSPQFCGLESRLKECASIFSSSIKVCKSLTEATEQRQELELVLLSILMDDESIKTNEDIEIEKGYTPSHLQMDQMKSSKPSKTKFLLKKKFNFEKRRKKSSKLPSANDIDMARIDFAAAAFLSESTPASEITRVISDQMQVLSLVEKNMSLRSYEGKRGKNTKAKNGLSGLKSPSRRRAGKMIGSELSGFDYVIRTGAKSNSLNVMNGKAFSSPRASRQREMIGGSGSHHQRLLSVGSDATSATSSLSSDSSVITSTSFSSIPTISGPNRDTSTWKKNERKNKIRKATEANNQSRSFNFAVSMENGGMGQSPPRNQVVQGSIKGAAERQYLESFYNKPFILDNSQTVPSKFDPFDRDHKADRKNNSEMISAPNQSNSYSNYSFRRSAVDSTTSRRGQNLQNGKTGNDPIAPQLPTYRMESAPPPSNRDNYIPGSRKLFVNVALNEDLSCTYRKSKLNAHTTDGSIQILLKSDSTAFVPFTFVLTDLHDHIEKLIENTNYASIISSEDYIHDADVGTRKKFIVKLPKYDHYFPILKYRCKPSLIPVPLRVQSRVRTKYTDCQVAIQISSNPGNERNLSNLTIIMVVPRNVLGETLTTQPAGGFYDASKRSVIWCVPQLGAGEKFHLHSRLKLEKSVSTYGESPIFPIMVKCQSLYTHLSGIVVECQDEPKGFPANVDTKVAKRFCVTHRERDPVQSANKV